MKKTVAICLSLMTLQVFAQIENDQSTTGPFPPKGIDITGHISDNMNNAIQQIISGVPAYLWYRGCGPTSVGMVCGYFDTHGFPDLIPGDASTQTTEVNAVIASTGNYNDYCLPIDVSPNLLPDKSEPPIGDEHYDNCIADYMFTSQSYKGNYYGWSWGSHIKPSWENYISNYVSQYNGICEEYTFVNFSWDSLINNINRNCPLVFLVDTDGNGGTDHFICVNGYQTDLGVNYYGCLNTWDANQHWYAFRQIASGTPWGISRCYTFQIRALNTGILDLNSFKTINIYPNPARNKITIANNGDLEKDLEVSIYNIQGEEVFSKFFDNQKTMEINVSSFANGLYLVKIQNKKGYTVKRVLVQ